MRYIVFLLLLLAVHSSLAITNITACGALSSSDRYLLQNNITTTGTCLTIGANDVVIDCQNYTISYGTAGASSVYGVFSSSHTNVTVQNCNIRDPSSSGSTNRAIYYLDTVGGAILNNNLTANGTTSIETVRIEMTLESATTLLIANNTVNSQGTGINVRALYLVRSDNNTVLENRARATSGNNVDSMLVHDADNNIIEHNEFIVDGSTTSGFTINVVLGSTNNTISNNNATVLGTASAGTRGVIVDSDSSDTLIENNTIAILAGGTTGGGPRGISISTNSHRPIIRDNHITMDAPNTEFGIMLHEPQDSIVTGNTVVIASGNPASSAFRIVDAAQNTYLANNVFDSANWWMRTVATSMNTTVINQTFQTSFGSILLGAFSFDAAQDINTSTLSIGNLSAFINSTNNSILNTSGRVTFTNTSFLYHRVLVDYSDDGTFVPCTPPDCTEINDTPGQIIFDVAHFTAFSTEEFIEPVPEFSTIALMALLVVALGGFFVQRKHPRA